MNDKTLTIRIPRRWAHTALVVVVTALVVAPLAAVASHSFTDVPDSNIFHADIEWLKDAGVTRGCNPPDNTEFCPQDPVTREAMAAFMRRLAQYLDAEDGTPAQADNANTLDGKDSTEFLGITGKAADADKLDGKDSAVFVEGSELVAAFAGGAQVETVTITPTVVRSVTVTAPVDGKVIVTSTAAASEDTGGDQVACSITTGTTTDSSFLQGWESAGLGAFAQLAGTRGFDVTAGSVLNFNLVCEHFGQSGSSDILDSSLTAIFIPNP